MDELEELKKKEKRIQELCKQEQKVAFCKGFAYGCRYGYEDILDGEMSDRDIASTSLLSAMLFDRLEKTNV